MRINSFIIIILIFLYGCKKEKNPASASNSGNGGVVITSSNASSWYALFNVVKEVSIVSGNKSITYFSQVFFSSVPTSMFDGSTAVRVDSVKMDGIPLAFGVIGDSSYVDTTGFSSGVSHIVTCPYTYAVIGKNGIPTFSYTETGPFPQFDTSTVIPDTIHKNTGLTLSLQGIGYADNVLVTIHNIGQTVTKTFSSPLPPSAMFNSSELNLLDTSNYSSIEVNILRLDNKNVGGRPMAFSMAQNVYKYYVKVRP